MHLLVHVASPISRRSAICWEVTELKKLISIAYWLCRTCGTWYCGKVNENSAERLAVLSSHEYYHYVRNITIILQTLYPEYVTQESSTDAHSWQIPSSEIKPIYVNFVSIQQDEVNERSK